MIGLQQNERRVPPPLIDFRSPLCMRRRAELAAAGSVTEPLGLLLLLLTLLLAVYFLGPPRSARLGPRLATSSSCAGLVCHRLGLRVGLALSSWLCSVPPPSCPAWLFLLAWCSPASRLRIGLALLLGRALGHRPLGLGLGPACLLGVLIGHRRLVWPGSFGLALLIARSSACFVPVDRPRSCPSCDSLLLHMVVPSSPQVLPFLCVLSSRGSGIAAPGLALLVIGLAFDMLARG